MAEENTETQLESYFDLSQEGYSYIHTEQIQDYLALADILLSLLLFEQDQENEEMSRRSGLGYDLSMVRLSLLPDADPERELVSYPIVRQALAYIQSREAENQVTGLFTPLFQLSDIYGLDFPERFLLVMACAPDLNRKYEAIYAELQKDTQQTYLTKGLAQTIYRMVGGDSQGNGFLEKLECLLRDRDERQIGSSLRGAVFPLDSVKAYLQQKETLPVCLDRLVSYQKKITKQDSMLGRDLEEQLSILCEAAPPADGQAGEIMQLLGRPGDGRKFALAQACRRQNCRLLIADANLFLAKMRESEDWCRTCLKELSAFSILQKAVVCLDGLEPEMQEKPRAEAILKYLNRQIKVLFFTSGTREHAYAGLGTEILLFEFPAADFHARKDYWDIFLKDQKTEETVDSVQMANVYQYNAGQIKAVTHMAQQKSKVQKHSCILRQDIVDSVRDYNSRRMGSKAHLVESVFDMDDIILDDYQKQQIIDVCNQIRNRSIVQEDWNFGRKTPYGKGVSILLYGAPGVGKTMSVQIISRMLGLDAYRIDLSQMVSKYIGETEKNLGEIFHMARNSCSILFFDEADALFAKRTEVKDSKDKYANMETAYILQKIEEHDGVVILASNHINNFDEAFQRRMQYIINIPLPGAQQRLQLWKSVFPEDAPMEEGIDFEFLAKQFELSGSRIKSIAIGAAYYAAEEQCPIGAIHIIRALQADMMKSRRMLSAAELGPYENLYRELEQNRREKDGILMVTKKS